MMLNRKRLQAILEKIIGNENVYFQPPSNINMSYPAIVYSRERIETRYADDIPYEQQCSYTITVIDKDPDSELVEKVSKLPLCRHDRSYTFDNLYHDVFKLYY